MTPVAMKTLNCTCVGSIPICITMDTHIHHSNSALLALIVLRNIYFCVFLNTNLKERRGIYKICYTNKFHVRTLRLLVQHTLHKIFLENAFLYSCI